MTSALIAAGADVNAGDGSGDTALMIAGRAGNTALMEQLVGAGADVNARNRRGEAALHGPANMAVAELLLSQGADVDAESALGGTPGWLAALNAGNSEVAELLVSAGADVDRRDRCGDTKLSRAVWRGNGLSARRMVEWGADVEAGGAGTPLGYAAYRGDVELAGYLISAGADVDGTYHQWRRGPVGPCPGAFEVDDGR